MNLRKGQSIVEVVIATAIISVAVVAGLALTNYTQKQANYSRLLETATSYNGQVVDWLRDQRSLRGWNTLADKFQNDASGDLATYCLSSPLSESLSVLTISPGECAPGSYITNTIFIRQMTVNTASVADGKYSVTVTTTWLDSGNVTRVTTLTSEYTQWN